MLRKAGKFVTMSFTSETGKRRGKRSRKAGDEARDRPDFLAAVIHGLRPRRPQGYPGIPKRGTPGKGARFGYRSPDSPE